MLLNFNALLMLIRTHYRFRDVLNGTAGQLGYSGEVCLQFYGNCHSGFTYLYVSKIHNNMTLGRFTVILMSSGAQNASIPKPENVSQLEESGVDQDGERVLLEELGEEHHSFTLLPDLP